MGVEAGCYPMRTSHVIKNKVLRKRREAAQFAFGRLHGRVVGLFDYFDGLSHDVVKVKSGS
jgi:hypothetical protein